ncbi:MAG: c-type cytochrome [Halioglobus sp.]|nr:c-type cytochrome [Halioglobus sp.]
MGPESGWGFTLPEGDPEAGEQTFVELRCTDCHSVRNQDRVTQPENPQLSIALGGEVRRIKTYGELVTAIINPSHKISRGYPPSAVVEEGRSKMRAYNDIMTVQQLSDLVAYLQNQYSLRPRKTTEYQPYF